MERLNIIGIEAVISNTGHLLAEVYVEGGGHEKIAQVPVRNSDQTKAIGYAYTRESDIVPGQQETAWKFHALPHQGLALLQEFAKANNIGNLNVQQALDNARVMAASTSHQVTPIRQISSYAIGQSRAA
jgi:hypothetical protein